MCLLCPNSDVQWRCQHGRAAAVGALADHAVEYLDDVFVLPVGEVGDEHAGDRVAADGPVPQLLSGPQRDRLLLLVLTVTSFRPALTSRCRKTLGSATWNSRSGWSSGGASNSGTTACAALMKTCRASNSAGFHRRSGAGARLVSSRAPSHAAPALDQDEHDSEQ